LSHIVTLQQESVIHSLVNHLLHHDIHFLKMSNIDAATNTKPLKWRIRTIYSERIM